eukprot:10548689-Alexandrium_andersonii.AAC.1
MAVGMIHQRRPVTWLGVNATSDRLAHSTAMPTLALRQKHTGTGNSTSTSTRSRTSAGRAKGT